MNQPAARRSAHLAATVLAMLVSSTGALAQSTVYRCGAEGREYSSTPCAGGKAVPVEDVRSADQRHQADGVLQRDKALANKLAAERRERESANVAGAPARLNAAASAPAAAASKPKAKHPKRKTKQPDDPRMSAPVRAASSPR